MPAADRSYVPDCRPEMHQHRTISGKHSRVPANHEIHPTVFGSRHTATHWRVKKGDAALSQRRREPLGYPRLRGCRIDDRLSRGERPKQSIVSRNHLVEGTTVGDASDHNVGFACEITNACGYLEAIRAWLSQRFRPLVETHHQIICRREAPADTRADLASANNPDRFQRDTP